MDVDGVITNLKDKKANPRMIQHIYNELANGITVALNTGRSLDAVAGKVISPLTLNYNNKSFLEKLIVVGEKGGTWMTFDEDGEPQKHVDKSISISPKLKKDIGNLIAAKYSKSMFYDMPKKTMISIEMKDGYGMSKYEKNQRLLIPEVEKVIERHGLKKVLTIEPNPIALDIQNKHVGKHLGIKRILNWLKERKIKVSSFITIGDMPSDVKMAEELYKNNFSVTHVHVGEKKIEGKRPFEIIATANHYENGALEFLKRSAFRS